MKYFERDEAAGKQEKERLDRQANERGLNAPVLFLRGGLTVLRILPAYDEKRVIFASVHKHFVRVPGQQAEKFACPAMTVGQPCAVCDKGQELAATRDPANMAYVREHLRPRQQYLYNVLCFSAPADKEGKTPEFGKVYVLETGVMVHHQITGLDLDAARGWHNITDLGQGVTLTIKRTGSTKNDTRYEVQPHGSGRSNVVAELATKGVDINTLSLYALDKVYAMPAKEELELLAARLGPVQAVSAPSFQPVMTVQPQSPGPVYTAPTATFVAPAPAAVPAPAGPVAAPISAAPAVAPLVAPEIPVPPPQS